MHTRKRFKQLNVRVSEFVIGSQCDANKEAAQGSAVNDNLGAEAFVSNQAVGLRGGLPSQAKHKTLEALHARSGRVGKYGQAQFAGGFANPFMVRSSESV